MIARDSRGTSRALVTGVVVVVLLIAFFTASVGGATLGSRFFAALRIARPRAVAAPTIGTAASARRLQNVVMGIVAETTAVEVSEADAPLGSVAAAQGQIGFAPRLIHARVNGAPKLSVVGTQRVSARVKRSQLRTLLAEAGRRSDVVPDAVDGQPIVLTIPSGVRAEYGNCPKPVANTLQNQINGPPPPSADNGSCVIVTETPPAVSATPAGLDTAAVLEIALELTGMSPVQARTFRQLFDWPSAIALSPPRFVRSYDVVSVGRGRGLLMTTGGRRGPTYVLAWVDGGIVYTLTGYGSSADAVPLANSVSQ